MAGQNTMYMYVNLGEGVIFAPNSPEKKLFVRRRKIYCTVVVGIFRVRKNAAHPFFN